ncbi:RPM1-interacting protein 4 [Platanthera guangdongensis]|uniref:RPM1-interacting protein 4 n=1 Tax=Platanthera guangdongensis TaxID=2320717 RepID=A0ABR2M4C0_9ASPA
MQKNGRVPQFGKWDNDGSVPYTRYFEEARKEKNAAKLINPNDPLQNPEGFRQPEPQRRSSHSNGEFEHSVERSPIHSHIHSRASSKGGISSPAGDRRASSEKQGLAPNTPGRTRMKHNDRSDYSGDKSSTVPKFGDWDVMDPASADSYSYIFNQVREEKHSGSAKPSSFSRDSKSDGQKRKTNSESTVS